MTPAMTLTCAVTASSPRNLLLHCGCGVDANLGLLWVAPAGTDPAEPSLGVVPAHYLDAGVIELPADDVDLKVLPAQFDLTEMNETVHGMVGTSTRRHLVVGIFDGINRRRWFLREASVMVGQARTDPGSGWRTSVTVDVDPVNAICVVDLPNLS